MKRIGLISDTHGTFDQTLKTFLKDVDEIWHAGDIGSPEVADQIAAFKPLRAVYGNIDGGIMRRTYREFLSFECEGDLGKSIFYGVNGVEVGKIQITGLPGILIVIENVLFLRRAVEHDVLLPLRQLAERHIRAHAHLAADIRH